jgi:hypothetical protein
MTFSPLISGTVPHNGKYSSRQGRPVAKVVQHHWAGTGGGIERMSGPDQASTTYLILSDGRILGHVPEEFRPWTSGSFEADGDAITIEVQNTGGQVNGNDSDPASWPISAAAHNSIIALLADVARRYGWADISSSNYRGHREFSSTACPGGYLWNRMDHTRTAAQALFSGGISAQGTITPTVQEDDMAQIPQEEWEIVKQQLAGLVDNTAKRHKDTSDRLDSLPAKVLSEPFTRTGTDGKPQGETTIKDTLGTLDANIVIDRSLFNKPVTVVVDSLIAAGITKEILDGIAERMAGQ